MLQGKLLKDYLEKLSKKELIEIINSFHVLSDLNNEQRSTTITGEKKDILVDYLKDYYPKYIKYIIKLLDKDDYNSLIKMIKKSSIIGIDNEFLKYLNNKYILFNNEMDKDTYNNIKIIIKKKRYKKIVLDNTKYYNLAKGIIIAYGVIDINKFKEIINNDYYNKAIELYYKKEYVIDNKKVYSNKLTNKRRINKYLKNTDIKEFKQKEFIDLGNNKYHHSIKSYKKLIRILKRKYIFKNYDIMFLDNFIITPYLYSSLNEEKQVSDDLNKVIDKYFEFNNTNLKRVIIKNISEVKNEFPLWEKRGKSLKEVE